MLKLEYPKEIGKGKQFVYVISYEKGQKVTYPAKIGMCRKGSPKKKLSTYITTDHIEPTMDLIIWCDNAAVLEARLHMWFQNRRIEGRAREWFYLHPKEITNDIDKIWKYIPYPIGEQLKLRRLALRRTQEGMSKASGIKQATISGIESNSHNAQFKTVLRYAQCLDMRINLEHTPTRCAIP